MRTRIFLASAILLIFAGSLLGKWLLVPGRDGTDGDFRDAQRIVSTSPSITEVLFALGLGPRVSGVSRYCHYPPEAEEKPRIGGFLDPNLEALLALKPDAVITQVENEQVRSVLGEQGIGSLTVCHKNIEGILDSITRLGRALGAEAEADRIVAGIDRRLKRVREKTAGQSRPRVLLVIERDLGAGRVDRATVAARDGFYSRMITIAGGENACRTDGPPFPSVSAEAILWMDPQVIVEIVPPAGQTRQSIPSLRDDWSSLGEVDAVRHGRVHVIDDDFAFIPGPRFVLLVEKLAKLIEGARVEGGGSRVEG